MRSWASKMGTVFNTGTKHRRSQFGVLAQWDMQYCWRALRCIGWRFFRNPPATVQPPNLVESNGCRIDSAFLPRGRAASFSNRVVPMWLALPNQYGTNPSAMVGLNARVEGMEPNPPASICLNEYVAIFLPPRFRWSSKNCKAGSGPYVLRRHVLGRQKRCKYSSTRSTEAAHASQAND